MSVGVMKDKESKLEETEDCEEGGDGEGAGWIVWTDSTIKLSLLWIDKARAKEKTYIWVSVRWKTKN